jgi:hypothetical protein
VTTWALPKNGKKLPFCISREIAASSKYTSEIPPQSPEKLKFEFKVIIGNGTSRKEFLRYQRYSLLFFQLEFCAIFPFFCPSELYIGDLAYKYTATVF